MHGMRVVAVPLVAGLFGVALSGLLASQSVPPMPPAAPVRPVTDTLHGVAVTDLYRWMEDGGQEFTDWLKAQDAYTRAILERIPGREKIAAELLNIHPSTLEFRIKKLGIRRPLQTVKIEERFGRRE